MYEQLRKQMKAVQQQLIDRDEQDVGMERDVKELQQQNEWLQDCVVQLSRANQRERTDKHSDLERQRVGAG